MKDRGVKPKIFIEVTLKQEMNAYLYAGTNGNDYPTLQVISGNQQAAVGGKYQIDVDNTVFIVAYPNINQQSTELDMTYWIDEEIVEPFEPDNSYLNDTAE